MLQKLNKRIAAEALDVAKKLHLEYSDTAYSCSLISPELGLTIKITTNPAYERKCTGYYSTKNIEHFDCDHPMIQFMINNHKKEYCDIIYYSEPIDFPEDELTFINWVEELLDEDRLKEIWFPIEKKYIESMVKYLGKNYVKNYEYDINWIQETYGAEWAASIFKVKNKKAKKVSVKVEPDDWNDIYNSILDDILDEAGQGYEDVDSDNLYNDIAMIMENFEYEGKVDADGDPEDWNDLHNAISDFIHASINTSDYLPKHTDFDEATKSSRKPLEDLNPRDAYNKRQREIDRENRATLSFGETCDAMDKEFIRKVYRGSDPNWKHWGYSFDDQFFVCTVAEDNPKQFCFETYVNRDRVDENTRRGYFGDPSELVALFWEYIDSFAE